MDFSNVFKNATPMLLKGFGITVGISILAIIIGLVIGLLVCFMYRSEKVVPRAIAKVYIWCIRGTPMIVQAFLVFFAFPQVLRLIFPDFTIDAFSAGLITLALNAGAYMSEIFRGGLSAVDPGQIEAARSLGLSQRTTMIKVVLPQALRVSIPSLVNQFIITIKDSSILSVIGLADLVNQAKVYVGSTYDFFPTYIVVAGYYLILLSVLMVFSKYIEKKLNPAAPKKHNA